MGVLPAVLREPLAWWCWEERHLGSGGAVSCPLCPVPLTVEHSAPDPVMLGPFLPRPVFRAQSPARRARAQCGALSLRPTFGATLWPTGRMRKLSRGPSPQADRVYRAGAWGAGQWRLGPTCSLWRKGCVQGRGLSGGGAAEQGRRLVPNPVASLGGGGRAPGACWAVPKLQEVDWSKPGLPWGPRAVRIPGGRGCPGALSLAPGLTTPSVAPSASLTRPSGLSPTCPLLPRVSAVRKESR